MQPYTVILSPEPNLGGYSASCPAMPGAFGQGQTREEALESIRAGMEAWLEAMAERGGGALTETPELVARALAAVLEDRAAEGWDLSIETATVQPAIASAA